MTDDEAAIRKLVDTWMTATRDGRLEAVLDLMTDDVVFMTAGQEPFGKEAFRAGLCDMGDMRIDGHSRIEELQVLGDFAYMRNHLDMTITMPGGNAPVRRSGYTLTIFRKMPDGRWLLSRDANMMPPPGPSSG